MADSCFDAAGPTGTTRYPHRCTGRVLVPVVLQSAFAHTSTGKGEYKGEDDTSHATRSAVWPPIQRVRAKM